MSDTGANTLHAVRPLRARILAVAVPVALEAAGLLGFVLVCRGVYLNWGQGWALIVAGAPLAGAYTWHSIRAARRRGTE